MSPQEQARALMIRHQQMNKNREQCALSRAAAEVGMPAEAAELWSHVHNRSHAASNAYNPSNVGMS